MAAEYMRQNVDSMNCSQPPAPEPWWFITNGASPDAPAPSLPEHERSHASVSGVCGLSLTYGRLPRRLLVERTLVA